MHCNILMLIEAVGGMLR